MPKKKWKRLKKSDLRKKKKHFNPLDDKVTTYYYVDKERKSLNIFTEKNYDSVKEYIYKDYIWDDKETALDFFNYIYDTRWDKLGLSDFLLDEIKSYRATEKILLLNLERKQELEEVVFSYLDKDKVLEEWEMLKEQNRNYQRAIVKFDLHKIKIKEQIAKLYESKFNREYSPFQNIFEVILETGESKYIDSPRIKELSDYYKSIVPIHQEEIEKEKNKYIELVNKYKEDSELFQNNKHNLFYFYNELSKIKKNLIKKDLLLLFNCTNRSEVIEEIPLKDLVNKNIYYDNEYQIFNLVARTRDDKLFVIQDFIEIDNSYLVIGENNNLFLDDVIIIRLKDMSGDEVLNKNLKIVAHESKSIIQKRTKNNIEKRAIQ